MAQTKLHPMVLLLGAFVAKNQEIYKDDPAMLASFHGLTLADLSFGPIVKTNGVHSTTITSASRGFEGPDQKWRPASVHSDHVFTLTSEEPLDNKEAVQALTTPGVFAYLDAEAELKHAVVIAADTAELQHGIQAGIDLLAALNYSVPADQLVVDDAAGTITVDGDTLTGVIEYFVAKTALITLPEGDVMDLGNA